MDKEAVFNRIRNILVAELAVNHNEVVPGSEFRQDLGMDSLDCVEVIMAIEEDFDVVLNDDEVEKLKTVDELVEHVLKITSAPQVCSL